MKIKIYIDSRVLKSVLLSFEPLSGSSIKYVRSDFEILDPTTLPATTHTRPPPSTCTYDSSLQPLLPQQEHTHNIFKEDSTGIFCELLLIKEPQTTLQNKETTVPSYRQMSNQNTTKSPGIEFALFKCTGEMEMDNFGYLNNQRKIQTQKKTVQPFFDKIIENYAFTIILTCFASCINYGIFVNQGST